MRLDTKIASIGCVCGLLLLFFTIAFKKGIGLSLTLFFSFLLYLILFRKKLISLKFQSPAPRKGKTPQIFCLVNTILLTAFLIFSVSQLVYSRSFGYFLLASILCVIIALEIWICDNSSKILPQILLLQILLVSASLRWGILFEFPGFVGSDPWAHAFLTENFLENGHIVLTKYRMEWTPLISEVASYRNFPFYHLIVAINSLVTSFPSLKTSIALSVGILEIISLVFVFLICRNLSDVRMALFATLLVGVSNWHIVWGFWLIPMSIGISFFALMVYLGIYKNKGYNNFVMIFLLTFVIMLSHTLSSFVLIVTFLASFFAAFLYSKLNRETHRVISPNLVTFTAISIISYWIFSTNFFTTSVRSLFYDLTSLKRILALSPPIKTYVHYEYDNLGIYMLYILVVVGCLSWLNKRNRSPEKFVTLGAITALFCFLYGFLFFGLTSILPERWFPFLLIISAPAIAEGFRQVVYVIRPKFQLVFVVLLIFSVSFLMITSGDANMDSPLFAREEVERYSYLESEICAANAINKSCHGNIYTDPMFCDYFWWKLKREINDINFEEFARSGGIMIIRNYIYNHWTRLERPGPYVRFTGDLEKNLQMMNVIYSNNEVKAYQNATQP